MAENAYLCCPPAPAAEIMTAATDVGQRNTAAGHQQDDQRCNGGFNLLVRLRSHEPPNNPLYLRIRRKP
jgi:hypothetical protein